MGFCQFSDNSRPLGRLGLGLGSGPRVGAGGYFRGVFYVGVVSGGVVSGGLSPTIRNPMGFQDVGDFTNPFKHDFWSQNVLRQGEEGR